MDLAALDDALRGEDAERDRQVERRAGLAHVGRRQVDRDAMRRKLEAGVPDRAPDAVAALADARVGQPDHREAGQAERDVDFDVDGAGVDPEEGGGPEAGEHMRTGCKTAARTAAGSSVFNDVDAEMRAWRAIADSARPQFERAV